MKTSALLTVYLKKSITPLVPLLQVGVSGIIAYIIGFKLLIYFLILLILTDFISGFWAYLAQNNIKLKWNLKGEWALKSDLLKRNGAKLGVYFIVICSIGFFEMNYFKIEFDKINELVDRSISGTEITTLFFCMVELLSVLENAKKIGFDLIGWFKKVFEKIQGLKKGIKDLLKW